MSTLVVHGSMFLLFILAALAADKLVYTRKIHTIPHHPPANGSAPAFAADEGFTEGFAAVALPVLGSREQHTSKERSEKARQSLFPQIYSSEVPSSDSGTSSGYSIQPDRISSSSSEGAHVTQRSSAHGMSPDYFFPSVSLAPYAPLQSANAPIYVSNAEETKTSIPELWGQGFRSLASAGGWQNLFAIPEIWNFHPSPLGRSYRAPGPFVEKVKPQGRHVDMTSGKKGVCKTSKLWKVVSGLQLWLPWKVLPSRSGASPTTCILCVLLVVYLYLLYRLVLLCRRLQYAQQHMLPVFHSASSCSSECSPQQQGLPSGALLIRSHSSYCSGLMESTTRHVWSSSQRFGNDDRNDPRSDRADRRDSSCSVLNSPQLLVPSPVAGGSRWQYHTALRGLRSAHTCTRSLQKKSWLMRKAESLSKPKCGRQPRGDGEQQGGEERTRIPQSKLKQLQEELEQHPVDEKEQRGDQIADLEHGIDSTQCRIASEARADSPSEHQTAYLLLCYPGLWRATAYNPYLLSSSMRCVSLYSKLQRTSWDPPHKHTTRDYMSSARVNFCDEQQPILHGEAAMHLAATYMRQRSFAWWEAYFAICCGCTCSLLVLSAYSDVVRSSSLDTPTTAHKHCLFASHADKDLHSRSCAQITASSLSSLFHAGENKRLLSTTGALVALLQWLASVCLLRACLTDCSQSTMHRHSIRSKAKVEAAAAALSLFYVFSLFCIVPSLFSVSPLLRSSRLFPTTYDLARVPAYAREWHHQQNRLWTTDFSSQQVDEYGAPTRRRDEATVDKTASRKGRVGSVLVEEANIIRSQEKHIADAGRPPFSEVGDEQAILTTGQLPAPALSRNMNYTAADTSMTRESSAKEQLGSVYRSLDPQDPASLRATMQQRRLTASSFIENQLEIASNVQQQQQQTKEDGKRPHEYEARHVDERHLELMITVGIVLLSLCHAAPRLWALYAVLKLVREDDFLIVRRNSRAKPSFTALVWGVGFSLVDLLPLPIVTYFLPACDPWEVFPVCWIDLLLCVQGVHVYLLFAHARREITTTEDSALLKRAINCMQQTFQLNVFR